MGSLCHSDKENSILSLLKGNSKGKLHFELPFFTVRSRDQCISLEVPKVQNDTLEDINFLDCCQKLHFFEIIDIDIAVRRRI